jgi:hypothetical protein
MTTPHKLLLFVAMGSTTLTSLAQCAAIEQGPQVLSLSIATIQESLKTGDPVLIDVTLTNRSSQDVSIWRENGPDAGESYRIEMWNERNEVAAETKLGRYKNGHVDLAKLKPDEVEQKYLNGSGGCLPMKAGSSLHDKVNVGLFYDLSKAGKYKVQVSVTDPATHTAIQSNIVSLTIE